MLFYLVMIAGFGPLSAGTLLAVALLWDAAFDLAIARWIDAHGGSNGLARLVMIGAPLCGLSFWLIFLVQAPVAVAAAIIACRIGYSLCDVGHNTLLIRVARSSADAGRVSGLRLLFSAAGVALLSLGAGLSLSRTDASAQHDSFAGAAMVGGALYVATLFLAVWSTRNLPGRPAAARRERTLRPLRVYWRDPQFRRLLVVIATQAALVPLFQRALPFYGAAVHGDPSWAGSALFTVTIAQTLALTAWIAASRRYSARMIAMAAHGIALLSLIGLTMTDAAPVVVVLMAVLGIALGGMNLAIWALLTAIVQAGLASGSQQEATPVGLFLAGLKAAAAVGNLLLAAIIAAEPHRLPRVTGESITLLPAIVTLVPAAGCIIILGLLAKAGNGGIGEVRHFRFRKNAGRCPDPLGGLNRKIEGAARP
jgi:Na+/melibiose symporter-like transporter